MELDCASDLTPRLKSSILIIVGVGLFFNGSNMLVFFGKWVILRLPVTRPKISSTPLCHTYSEPPGHELSPGGTQNIPYLYKKLSKSLFTDPFFWRFLVIFELGSQIYIVK